MVERFKKFIKSVTLAGHGAKGCPGVLPSGPRMTSSDTKLPQNDAKNELTFVSHAPKECNYLFLMLTIYWLSVYC